MLLLSVSAYSIQQQHTENKIVYKRMPETKDRVEIKGHSFYLEDNILYAIAGDEVNDEIATKIKEIVLEMLKDRDKTNTLVDVNKSKNSSFAARRTWKELTEHEKTGKVAYVGNHPVAQVNAQFIMHLSGNKEIRFFYDREKALGWLKN
jgi:hypothetical protein